MNSTLLLDGLMCRYKDLRNGSRQISELHVSGDFVDLHSFTLKKLDHNIMALTPCRIAQVPHERLKAITEQFPHLTRVLWFSTNLDAAIHREWVLSLGRRTALARLAHLFCELHARLQIVGLTDGLDYKIGLTQSRPCRMSGADVDSRELNAQVAQGTWLGGISKRHGQHQRLGRSGTDSRVRYRLSVPRAPAALAWRGLIQISHFSRN